MALIESDGLVSELQMPFKFGLFDSFGCKEKALKTIKVILSHKPKSNMNA